MISDRHKRALVNAYRNGTARRSSRYHEPRPITTRPQDHDTPDERAFQETRETLVEGGYRHNRLPTADEQFAGIDPRDDA